MPKFDALLIPADFSSASSAAIHWACDLAERLGSHVHLLHVASGGANEDVRCDLLQQLQRLVSPEQALRLKIHREVLLGVPHREIVDYASKHQIDLIIMGTEGRSGLAHFALGSVAERVLRAAPCPVMVVKSDAAHKSARIRFEAVDASRTDEDADPYGSSVELVRRAVSLRATDVHLDPCEDDQVLVRMRIDGKIEEYCRLDAHVASQLIQQLKLAAQLDIAEPFLPKEGRLKLPSSMADHDVRVTTCRVADGDAVALRILSRESVFHPLAELGLSPASLGAARQMLRADEGIILVTGPTGCGKTTTVYSMLRVLADERRNIVSIEDPVEFVVPFIRQMSVDARHGITMTSGLRTLLRMDPDILFLGEIRDAEAADIAMQAASSGHHVLSTLHTRDVAATVTALRDLRVGNHSVSSNLAGIINQRLIRRLCSQCRREAEIDDRVRATFEQHEVPMPTVLYRPQGCDACRGTGFRGRTGVFEAVPASREWVDAILQGVAEDQLRTLVRLAGTPSLTSDGLLKARDGITSVEEAITMRWM